MKTVAIRLNEEILSHYQFMANENGVPLSKLLREILENNYQNTSFRIESNRVKEQYEKWKREIEIFKTDIIREININAIPRNFLFDQAFLLFMLVDHHKQNGMNAIQIDDLKERALEHLREIYEVQ